MEAIILAGGLGTRLRSRLSDRPKAMAPIAGRPFLEILLDRLIRNGCSRIILSVGYLRDIIIERFGSNYLSVPIDYAIEESPLGTGGAIRSSLMHVCESEALVLNGDTFLDLDYPALMAAHQASGAELSLALGWVPEMARYGGVIIEKDCITGFTEKGKTGTGWINAGVYVLRRDFPWPEHLGQKFSFETDLLVPCLSTIQIHGFKCRGYFLDIGIPEDLNRAQIELANNS